MNDEIIAGEAGVGARWEYKVIRVNMGSVAYQKYGPETPVFESTLNEWGQAGWEAFHAQALAEGEVLLVFLKRPAPPESLTS
jgi:hypothetical protein